MCVRHFIALYTELRYRLAFVRLTYLSLENHKHVHFASVIIFFSSRFHVRFAGVSFLSVLTGVYPCTSKPLVFRRPRMRESMRQIMHIVHLQRS
jgi:hypothetical protein